MDAWWEITPLLNFFLFQRLFSGNSYLALGPDESSNYHLVTKQLVLSCNSIKKTFALLSSKIIMDFGNECGHAVEHRLVTSVFCFARHSVYMVTAVCWGTHTCTHTFSCCIVLLHPGRNSGFKLYRPVWDKSYTSIHPLYLSL